jgi:4-amino-4-deoxy-L-arabinose transferase-like glycosyltransferase
MSRFPLLFQVQSGILDPGAVSKVRYRWLLAAIFLLALTLRLGLTWAFVGFDAGPDGVANYDGIEYEEFAYQLASGNGYVDVDGQRTAIRPPGFSALLAPLYWIFGRSHVVAHLWLCLMSAASCLAVAWATRKMLGPFVALIAAGWLALYPGHSFYSMRFLSEVPFALFMPLGIGLLYWARSRGGHLLLEVLSGLIIGFCILIRPQAVFMFPIAWVVMLAWPALRRRDVLRPAFIHSLLAVAVVVPWAARNHFAVGKFTISTIGGYTLWGANNHVVADDPDLSGSWIPVDSLIDEEHPVEGSEVEREAATWRYGFEFLRDHPGRIAPLFTSKLLRLFAPFPRSEIMSLRWAFAISWMVTGPLVLLGLWWLFRHRPAVFFLLVIPLVALVATALAFYGSIRFRDSLSTIFVIPAALGVCVALGWIPASQASKPSLPG